MEKQLKTGAANSKRVTMAVSTECEAFDVGHFMAVPGRKVIAAVVKARVRRGLLAEVARRVNDANMTILYLSSSTPRDEGPVKTLAFLDITDSEVTPDSLARQLEAHEAVDEVRVIEPVIEGFVADTDSCCLRVAGERSIILREAALDGLLLGMRERFGSGGKVIQYNTGFDVGLKISKQAKATAEKLGASPDPSTCRRIDAAAFQSLGYGAFEITESSDNPPHAHVRIRYCFECMLGGEAKEPFSHFVRGILAGVFTETTGTQMTAQEVACIAKGDPHCEFEITPSTGNETEQTRN